MRKLALTVVFLVMADYLKAETPDPVIIQDPSIIVIRDYPNLPTAKAVPQRPFDLRPSFGNNQSRRAVSGTIRAMPVGSAVTSAPIRTSSVGISRTAHTGISAGVAGPFGNIMTAGDNCRG